MGFLFCDWSKIGKSREKEIKSLVKGDQERGERGVTANESGRMYNLLNTQLHKYTNHHSVHLGVGLGAVRGGVAHGLPPAVPSQKFS